MHCYVKRFSKYQVSNVTFKLSVVLYGLFYLAYRKNIYLPRCAFVVQGLHADSVINIFNFILRFPISVLAQFYFYIIPKKFHFV